MTAFNALQILAAEVRGCQLCARHLAHGVRPVLQVGASARILLASQAPGRKVHASGRPFTDASGDRLRHWLGIGPEVFYDASRIAIVPMGFCYPGTGKSGDLPPRSECAPQWRTPLLAAMPQIQLTLLIGRYAIDWHLPHSASRTLTDTVRNGPQHAPHILPLPHPSPRNNLWLQKNPWFEAEVLPMLRARVREVLAEPGEGVVSVG